MMRFTVALLFALGLAAACGPATTKTESAMAKGNMQPFPKREFTKGASIRPTEGLVAWLDERKKADAKTVVRVPVTTSFDRISIKETKIGDLAEERGLFASVAVLEPEAIAGLPDGKPSDLLQSLLLPAVRAGKAGALSRWRNCAAASALILNRQIR